MMLLGISGPGLGGSPTCGYLTCYEDCSADCPSGQTGYLSPSGATICKPQCPAGQCYDQNGNCAANSEVAASGSSGGSSSSGWGQQIIGAATSLLSSFGIGIGKGLTTTPGAATTVCSNGSVVPAGMPCPVPWYQTTPGVIGILAVIGGVVYFLVKPSPKAASAPAAKAA